MKVLGSHGVLYFLWDVCTSSFHPRKEEDQETIERQCETEAVGVPSDSFQLKKAMDRFFDLFLMNPCRIICHQSCVSEIAVRGTLWLQNVMWKINSNSSFQTQ